VTAPTLLVVDDEALLRWSLKEAPRAGRLSHRRSGVGRRSGRESERHRPRPARLQAADGDGLTVLRHIKEQNPDTLVILMTAFSTIESAVEAMKAGAYHYINKPFNLDEMALLVEKALETSQLRREVKALRTSAGREYGFDSISAGSPAMTRNKVPAVQGRGEPGVDGVAHRGNWDRKGPRRQGRSLQQRSVGARLREHHLLRRCRNSCSKASCSGTSVAHSPMRGSRSVACSKRRTAAPCSSTRSAR
jgi:ActR/RegA family two-component response regulator